MSASTRVLLPTLPLILAALLCCAGVAGAEAAQCGEMGDEQVCFCGTPEAEVTPESSPSPDETCEPPIPSPSAQCTKHFSVPSLSFIADDNAELFVCGTALGNSKAFDDETTLTVSHMPCGDFLFRANNIEAQLFYLAVALYIDAGDGRTFGTTGVHAARAEPGVKHLHAVVKFEPDDDCFLEPASCDYSDWQHTTVVSVITDIKQAYNFRSLQQLGAYPVGAENGNVSVGMWGIKISNPLC